jgi:TonB family protein
VPDTYFRNVPDTVRLEFLVRELEIRYPNLKILSAGRTPAGRLVVRFDSIPGIGTVELSDFEIEDPRLEALNMEALLPPAPDPVLEEDPGPQFTPFDKAPALANRADMLKALMLEYPPVLKDAGIAGDVVLHFHIGSDGRVIETVLAESSGHTSMDEAAQRVAGIMEFNPAGNLGQDVAVWVQLTVKFTKS